MNFADLSKMSDGDALKLFDSIPNPPLKPINTDPHPLETILRDFSAMEISQEERKVLQDDLNLARGYSPSAT